MSPTQRTLAYLRDRGYTAVVTEYWHAFAKVRVDLFGIIDVVALRRGETLAVQCTDITNVSHRVTKIAEHENTPKLREAGWRIQVFGWTKGKPEPRVVDCS